MLFTCVTFVFFTILVAVISYVKAKGDDQTTADGYFLAGRGLPGVVIAGSLLLTNLSAEQLVGTNGQTWAIGMSPMAFEVMAATALDRAGVVCRAALPEKRHHHHPAAAR